MKIRIGDEVLTEQIRVRVRLDFRGEARMGKFFFGGKSEAEVAEQMREQQVTMLRNVPLQGMVIEDFDLSLEVYQITENGRKRGQEVAYAPIILTLRIENFDDLIPLLIKPEFRKIEFLSPENCNVNRVDLERLFFRFNQVYQQEIKAMEQHYQN